ncbi:MAG TPA: PAS domain S-box protein [Pirellulales bacterium]
MADWGFGWVQATVVLALQAGLAATPDALAPSWVETLGDSLIGLAFIGAALVLGFIAVRRSDMPHSWLAGLFGLTLLGCGAAHLFYSPPALGAPDPAATLKLLTGLTSVGTLVALIAFIPRALEMPSPDELDREVAQRTAELIAANTSLQRAYEGRVEALERLHGVVDQAIVGVVTFNEYGSIESANPAAARMFGYVAEDMIGRRIGELIPDAVSPDPEDSLSDDSRAGAPGFLGAGREAVGLRRSGEEFTVELAVSELRLPGRRLFTGIARDVTARQIAEAALKESQAYLNQLTRSLPLLLWTSQADGYWNYLSPQWVEYTGVPADQQIGRRWLEAVHCDDRERVRSEWEAAVASGRDFDAEFRILRRDGVHRWFKSRAVPVHGPAGKVVRWFGTSTDVDDLKRTEAAAAHGLAQLQAVVSTIADGVVVADREGHILMWNPAAERIHGYVNIHDVPAEIDDFIKSIVLSHPGGQQLAPEDMPMARILRGETLSNCELQVRRKGAAHDLIVQYDGALAPGPDGQPALAVLTLRDVTDRKRAEGEWRRTAALLQALVNGVSDAVYVKDRQGKYLLFNPAAARFVGRPPAEVLGKDDAQLYSAADAEQVMQHDREVMASNKFETREETLTAAGVTRTFLATKGPYRDASGALAGVFGISHDISERKRTEEQLRASEARFRLLVDGVRDFAIFLIGVDGRVATWTAGAERLNGYRPDEIVGLPVAVFHTPDAVERDEPATELQQAAAEGRCEGEGWRVRKDGTKFWARVILSALREPGGRLQGYVAMIRDLTDRRRSDVLLKSIMDSVRDGVLGVDEQGKVHFVNRAAERIFGYPAAELVGESVAKLLPESDARRCQAFFTRLRAKEVEAITEGVEGVGRRKDGATFPVDLAVGEFFLDDGRYFTGVVRDVSERRKLEDQLRQSLKMEALGQLAAGVAHDFNNRLTVINGYSEMVLDFLPVGDPHRPSIAAIREAGERATALTAQLLAFGRRTLLEPRVLDANVIVSDTGKLLRRLISEAVTISIVPSPRPTRIWVDPGQLGHVLTTLALNARDAMPEGGRLTIEIRDAVLSGAEGASRANAARFVLISVSDTGVGMSDEVKGHIFEPMFTTKPSGTAGTAMGLATAYGVVRQSGGRIEVQSELGQGTTFRMYFPAVADERTAPTPQRPALDARGSESVLLVEDQDDVREFARIALEAHGYKVMQASSSEAALQLVESFKPHVDLLVTDVVMPGLNGRRLAEALAPIYPTLKVLYLSGYTDDTILRHGVAMGDSAFLPKPYGAGSLAQKVRAVLDAP